MPNDKELNEESIKEDMKQQIKEKLKKEILEEVYTELKSEKESLTEGIVSRLSEEQLLSPIETEQVKKSVQKNELIDKGTISISTKAILKIATHSLRFANRSLPKQDWCEVFGILGGKMYDYGPKLHIVNAYPITHGDIVSVVDVFMRDSSKFTKVYRHLKKLDQFICGWYHSHPSHGLFLSSDDFETHSNFQKQWEDSVALVMDPFKIDWHSYGFDIYRVDFKSNRYNKIPFLVKGALDVRALPELLEFLSPIVENKATDLEFEER